MVLSAWDSYMRTTIATILLNVLASSYSFGQAIAGGTPADAYQIKYFANLGSGDGAVNLSNGGFLGGLDPGGDICANVYVFAQDQQLVACCACPLTPNHLSTLSVHNDLISNTLTPAVPSAITVALVATQETGGQCNAAAISTNQLVSGLVAWGTTLHALPGGGYTVSETPFIQTPLGSGQFNKMTEYCAFIQAIGSGYGICNSCRSGAAGAQKQ